MMPSKIRDFIWLVVSLIGTIGFTVLYLSVEHRPLLTLIAALVWAANFGVRAAYLAGDAYDE